MVDYEKDPDTSEIDRFGFVARLSKRPYQEIVANIRHELEQFQDSRISRSRDNILIISAVATLGALIVLVIGKFFILYAAILIVLVVLEYKDVAKISKSLSEAYPRIIFELERAQAEALKISSKHSEYDYFLSLLSSMQDLATAGYNVDECGSVRFSGSVIPAMGVSGDFYDFHYHRTSGHTVFWVGDVGGKGVNAGVVMASIQSIMRTLLIANTSHELSLTHMLKTLNEVIYNNFTDKIEHTSNSATVSLFAYKGNTLTFTGQHENVILIKHGEPIPKVIGTSNFGPIVGLTRDGFKEVYCGTMHFSAGDKIVLYSDGIVEEITGSRSILGFDSFMQIIMMHRDLPPKEMKEQMLLSLTNRAGHQKFHDDVTLLIVEPK